jgi:hypothetical protein
LRRKTRAIQYGPWLAIGLFAAAAGQDAVLRALQVEGLLR